MREYAILMLFFSAALILYAEVLSRTKNARLIPRNHSVNTRDSSEYAASIAKIIGVTAIAPFASAIIALITGSFALSFIVLIVVFILSIWIGIRKFHQGKKS